MRIEHLPQAVVADRNVGRDQGMNRLTSTARKNSELPITVAREVCHCQAGDLCQGGRLPPKPDNKIINLLSRPLHFDGDPGRRITDFAG